MFFCVCIPCCLVNCLSTYIIQSLSLCVSFKMRLRISKRGSVRPSIRPSVRPSVRRSVGPWVGNAFVKNEENHYFRANNYKGRYTRQIWCNDIIIQSFHHHEDALLALWVDLWFSASVPKNNAPCSVLVILWCIESKKNLPNSYSICLGRATSRCIWV